MSNETYFQDSWFYEEEFQEWLVKGKENAQVKCRKCQKTNELSNMAIQALRSESCCCKKHLEIIHKILCFFDNSRTVEKEENSKAESVAEKGPKKCTKTSLELTLAFSEVAKSEIKCALDSVLKRN